MPFRGSATSPSDPSGLRLPAFYQIFLLYRTMSIRIMGHSLPTTGPVPRRADGGHPARGRRDRDAQDARPQRGSRRWERQPATASLRWTAADTGLPPGRHTTTGFVIAAAIGVVRDTARPGPRAPSGDCLEIPSFLSSINQPVGCRWWSRRRRGRADHRGTATRPHAARGNRPGCGELRPGVALPMPGITGS